MATCATNSARLLTRPTGWVMLSIVVSIAFSPMAFATERDGGERATVILAQQTEPDNSDDEPVLPPTDVEAEQPAGDPGAAPAEPSIPGPPTFERALNSAGTESVVSGEELDRRVSRSLNDIFRYEPGVQVQSSVGRFGETSINIRGLEGNRVLLQVDGIRSADSFQQGPVQLGRGLIDVDLLNQVEIYRGAGSLIYGEGALAGAVIFDTKDPEDFLNIFGRDSYASLKGSYFTADNSWAETAIIAKRMGNFDAMFAFTRRDGNDLESAGEFPSDFQDYHQNYALGKLVYHLDCCSELELAVEWLESETFTDLFSTLGGTFVATPEVFPGGLPADRFFAEANDRSDRLRYSLTYDFKDGCCNSGDAARLQVYYQETAINDTREQLFTVPAVAPPFGPPHIISNPSDNTFDQTHVGARAIFRRERWDRWDNRHQIVYGVDFLRTNTSRIRQGTVDNLSTGASVNSNQIGEPTPLKVLPDVATDRLGLFLRDRIEGPGGAWVTPGVRVNYYRADYDLPDPLFDDTNGTPENTDVWNAQPTIEIGAPITCGLTGLVRYARGFRGPPVEDAGIGFTNPVFGYTILPNPNLEPETSDGVDLGLSYNNGVFAGYVGGYYNRYDGFITNVTRGFDPTLGLLVFEQLNRDAQIYGVEAAAEWRLSPACCCNACDDLCGGGPSRWYGWSAFGNISYSVGDNLEDDVPLDSIPPLYGVAGLRYASCGDRWGAELVSTMVARKDRLSGDVADQFVTPGYGIIDLITYYNVSRNVQLNMAVYNLFDKTYFPWLNVRGVTNGQADRTRFAAPGVTFAASLRVQW